MLYVRSSREVTYLYNNITQRRIIVYLSAIFNVEVLYNAIHSICVKYYTNVYAIYTRFILIKLEVEKVTTAECSML